MTVPTAPVGVLAGFDVSQGTLQDLVLPKTNVRGFSVKVVLGGKTYALILREHDIRSSNFKLLVHDKNGIHVAKTPANITYRGIVGGLRDSIVAASLVGGQLKALVQLGKGQAFWGIQPVNEVNQTAKPSIHIVYHSSKNNLPAGRCGVTEVAAVPTPPAPFGPMGAPNKICEIGCDADNALYLRRGRNVTTTQNDVTSVMNGVATIYKRDVGIDYKITTIIVRTISVYGTNNLGTLLRLFQTRWNRFHTGVKRDTAHIFHGGTGGGVLGVAYLSTICNLRSSYGASKTTFTSNFTSRVAVTAHELGHSWSAGHCSGSACRIMCGGLGGCSRIITSFGTSTKNRISSYRNSRTCLSNAVGSAVLTGISPTTVQAFKGGTVTLTGSKFTKATAVNVGANTLTGTNFKIVSDTKITFESFTPTSMLPVLVNVQDVNGNSANKTLNYIPTSPPKLDAQISGFGRGVMIWQFGAQPAHLWFLTASLSSQTTSILGFNWLTTPILITFGKLDAAGAGGFGVLVPNNTPTGLKVYSQVVTLDGVNVVFAGNTNVTLTTTR
ncbi:MAG: M12 family metallo-peptidase [Planctomycetota bacterium]